MTDEDYENEGEFLVIEEPDTPKALTKEEAANCLNTVGPSYRKIDTSLFYSFCSYAYVAMNVAGRSLTQIDVITNFTHVMFLDVSRNRLNNESLVPLAEMEQLIVLIVDDNHVESAALPEFPQLQILSLRNNRITSCEVNHQPNLEHLELAGNNIQKVDPELWEAKKLPKLKELGLRNNGLSSTAGINFTHLVSLFLAENDIEVLEGLDVLTNLKFLHLRKNPLKKLDGFSQANCNLSYLNIRDCGIKNLKELKKLSILPKLERIVILDNLFSNKDYRVEVIAMLPKIRKIDKTLVETNEKRKAKRLAKSISQEGEENEYDENGNSEEDD